MHLILPDMASASLIHPYILRLICQSLHRIQAFIFTSLFIFHQIGKQNPAVTPNFVKR